VNEKHNRLLRFPLVRKIALLIANHPTSATLHTL